jgi:hypothetical protein
VSWGISRPGPQYSGDETTLPPEVAAFSYLLDALPAHVRDCFHYFLCLLMAQAGVIRLVEKVPGENGVVCVFATTNGDHFGVTRPAMSREQEAALIDVLREILEDEGSL